MLAFNGGYLPRLAAGLALRLQSVLARSREQPVAIEMRLAMVGERVERPLDRGLEADSARRSKQREPGRALAIVGEQSMHIGPGDLAALRHCAVEPPVGEAKERPRAVRTARLADMHLVALERRAIA